MRIPSIPRDMRAELATDLLLVASEDLTAALNFVSADDLSEALSQIDNLISAAKKARRMIAEGR
jgi:hypothetical protein